jgi:hypothetical protein
MYLCVVGRGWLVGRCVVCGWVYEFRVGAFVHLKKLAIYIYTHIHIYKTVSYYIIHPHKTSLLYYIYRLSQQHHVGEGEGGVGLPDRAAVQGPEPQAHVEGEAVLCVCVCVGVCWCVCMYWCVCSCVYVGVGGWVREEGEGGAGA